MPRFQAVCFDLFNTLVSVGRVPDSVGRYTADILGMDREHWNEVCFGPLHEICKPTVHVDVVRTLAHSVNPTLPDSLIRQAAHERQQRFDYSLRHVEPEVLETLQRLRARGLRIALISNASTGEISAWRDSPLAGYFDQAVFSCECGHKKPEQAIYDYTLAQIACKPEATVFVGDGVSYEFQGAKQAGLYTVLNRQHLTAVRYGAVMASQADAISAEVASLTELPAKLGWI